MRGDSGEKAGHERIRAANAANRENDRKQSAGNAQMNAIIRHYPLWIIHTAETTEGLEQPRGFAARPQPKNDAPDDSRHDRSGDVGQVENLPEGSNEHVGVGNLTYRSAQCSAVSAT
jgi:hypothetical protein